MDVFDLKSTSERAILDLRILGIQDVPVVGHYLYRRASGGLRREVHKEHFELTYLAKGVQIYESQGERTVLRGGDVFLTKPGELHSTAGQPEEKGEAYWMFVRKVPKGGSLLNFTRESTREALDLLLNAKVRRWRASRDVPTHLRAVFDLYAAAKKGALQREELSAHLTLLFLEMLKSLRNMNSQQLEGPIARALECLQCDGRWNISISDLAAEAHLSDARFKVRFKDEVGIPPGEYLMRRRIEKAKFWLRKPDHKIADIAKELGFPTSQYFATVFKRYSGRTPQDYKKRQQAGVEPAHKSSVIF